jgi:hypothetical protein
VSKVTRLRAGRPGFDIWKRQELFSLCHRIQTDSGVYPASYSMGTGISFPGVKRPEHEDEHSPVFGAVIKNACRNTRVYPKVSGLSR